MRTALRPWRWLLIGLCLPVGIQAQPVTGGTGPVQVFSKVSRTVVAVGVAFAFEVEVYASPVSIEAAAEVERFFMAAPYAPEEAGIDVVREASTVSGFREQTARPLVLVRRFVMRALQPGLHRLPAFRFDLSGQAYATLAHDIMVYEVDPDFIRSGQSVLPVIAERAATTWRQPDFVRVGSAFLIAPDALITSLHVIMDAHRVWVRLPDGKRVTTRKAWAIDPVRDVAILYIDPKHVRQAGMTPLQLAPDAESVALAASQVGEEEVAFTYGWPGGTQRSTAGLRYHGLTLQPGETLWITANPVRPGDSGGPLLDRQGRVLGAVSAGTVGGDRIDALHQEVCIAVDVRPALAQKLVMERPRSLRAMMRAPGFDAHPYVHALRLTTMLAMGQRVPEIESALTHLDTAVEQNNARLLFLRGVIHQMLGTRHRAAASYRASLDAFEGNFLSSYMLAQHHLQRKEYVQAEQLFRHTLQFEPYTYFAAYGLARSLMGRLRYREAIPLLQAVVTHDPTYAPAYYDLALCALALDDEPRARQLLAKLERVSPVRARQLQRVLREPLLRPRVLRELPRAEMTIVSLKPELPDG